METPHHFLPDDTELLLLKALLAPPEQAQAAAIDWLQGRDLMALNEGLRRLLPLLFHHMENWQLLHPSKSQLAYFYKHYWLMTARIYAQRDRILSLLQPLDIPLILLKGLALGPSVYPAPATRPTHDIDLFIAPQNFDAVRSALEQAGFTCKQDALHSCLLSREDVPELDLHRSPYHELYSEKFVQPLCDRILPLHGMASKAFALGHEDQLLHSILHGLYPNSVSPLRWVVDASFILRAYGPQFNWAIFRKEADRLGQSETVWVALDVIARLTPQLIPAHTQAGWFPALTAEEKENLIAEKSLRGPWATWRMVRKNHGAMKSLAKFLHLYAMHFQALGWQAFWPRLLYWARVYGLGRKN